MDIILEIGKTVNTGFFLLCYVMLRPAEVYELCIP